MSERWVLIAAIGLSYAMPQANYFADIDTARSSVQRSNPIQIDNDGDRVGANTMTVGVTSEQDVASPDLLVPAQVADAEPEDVPKAVELVSPETCAWRTVSNAVSSGAGGFGSSLVPGELMVQKFSCVPDESSGPVRYRRASAQPDLAPASPDNPRPGVSVLPTVGELAVRAVGRITVPVPRLHFGPDRDRVAVNVWTWMWVDEPVPISITVSAGDISVEATASLVSTRWTTNEPVKSDPSWPEPSGTPLVCQGSGSAPPVVLERSVRPVCAYAFRSRSTADRTGGSGTWTVTVTATWLVRWSANTGESGTQELTSSAQEPVRVGEWRTVLVSGDR